MTVRFTVEALSHIVEIGHFIRTRNPRAAARIVERIFAEADRLDEFPHLGHAGAVPDTYERIVPGLPYIIVHQVGADRQVIILGVFHGAQER